MSELLVIGSIDPIAEGRVYADSLPLHVTIAQDFAMPPENIRDFADDLGKVLDAFSPMEIIGTDPALFGPNFDRPVRLVKPIGASALSSVVALHASVAPLIELRGGVFNNPEWAYSGFNPHALDLDDLGDLGGRYLSEGKQVTMRQIALIKRSDRNRHFKIAEKVWRLEEA